MPNRDKDHAARDLLLAMAGRFGIVALCLFVLLLFSAVPLRIGDLGDIRPSLILAAVYYWAITRPATLPPLMAFVAGLIFDLLLFLPVGLTAFLLVAVQWLTVVQRKFMLGQSFPVIWAGFAFMALAAGLVQWLVLALFAGQFLPLLPVLAQAVVTSLCFPPAVPLLRLVNKMLSDQAEPR